MPAARLHGMKGASAESTERDQLAGDMNVRDADSFATDHSGELQRTHTVIRWLHIYTPGVSVFAHSRHLED